MSRGAQSDYGARFNTSVCVFNTQSRMPPSRAQEMRKMRGYDKAVEGKANGCGR